MHRKTVLINSVLGVAILGVTGGAVLMIHGAPNAAAADTRTVAVKAMDLSAVATASGNVSPSSTTVLNAQNCSGPILSVTATVGQQVSEGQVLVKIDTTNAANALAVAQASLQQAQQSAASAQDSIANQIASAAQSVTNAQQSASLDASQQAAVVSAAQNAIATDNAAVTAAQATATANPKSQQDQQAVSSAQMQASKDTSALTQAQNQQATSSLKDSQQIASSQTQLNSAQNTTSANNNTTSAQIAVQTAQNNLAACTLKAPTEGTVTAISAVVGGNAGSSSGNSGNSGNSGTSSSGAGSSASSSSTSSSASSGLLTISDTKALQVVANFAEANVSSLKVGEPATFTFPAVTAAAGSPAVTGKIASIAETATTTNNVVSYPVTISISNPPAALRLGQSANISVTTSQASDALAVPSLAITAQGSRQSVKVMANGVQSTVIVTTGITDNGETQILSGLTAGQEVVLPAISNTLQTGATPSRSGSGGLGGFTGGGSGFGGSSGGSGGSGRGKG